MPRLPLLLLAAGSCLWLSGCGGSKNDFAAKPAKYRIVTASPAAADAVTLAGVSRDGRVIGTYSKAGTVTTYGWTPDGEPSDIALPTECKAAYAINELGGVLCGDLTATPQRLYRYQNNRVEELEMPATGTVSSAGSMTFDSYFLVNFFVTGVVTRGFQLKIDEDPKAWTGDNGLLLGSSLSGNLVGSEAVGGSTQAIAVIQNKKVIVGQFSGFTSGIGINDSGVVVGGGDNGAYRWQSGKFTKLPVPVGTTASVALDINNEGVACGYVVLNGVEEACVWFKSGVSLIKDMTTLPVGVHIEQARRVTPLGIVVCTGTRNGKPEVFGLFPEFP